MSKSTQKAYDIIRHAVLSGDFVPGDRMKEEQLVQLCGVSRTPVRDAIKQLAAENYLVMKPNHGAHVAKWSEQEIDDIFKLRSMCECLAARRAAENITSDQIETLREQHKMIEDMLLADAELDIELFLKANKAFHDTILEATKSEVLRQSVFKLVSPPIVYQTALNFSRADLEHSNKHHRELIKALEERNGDWCEAVMQNHILAAHRRFKEVAL
jgi:DNA-binding GntR family transcriptional regulator